jgi:hypothetical protein
LAHWLRITCLQLPHGLPTNTMSVFNVFDVIVVATTMVVGILLWIYLWLSDGSVFSFL